MHGFAGVRGRLVDGLRTVEHAAAWLRDNRDRFAVSLDDADLLAVDKEDLCAIRGLRDAARTLIDAAARGTEAPADAVEELNRHVRRAPSWRELVPGPDPSTLTRTAASPVPAVLGEIAQATVEILTGPQRDPLRACQAPGCVLYFLKNHPRREWSGPECGNRAGPPATTSGPSRSDARCGAADGRGARRRQDGPGRHHLVRSV